MTVRTITTGLPKRNIEVTGARDSTTIGNRDQPLGIDTDGVLHRRDDKHLPMIAIGHLEMDRLPMVAILAPGTSTRGRPGRNNGAPPTTDEHPSSHPRTVGLAM
ncbi:MAG: hypothetical protein Q9171_000998 [Xanthocarpia ochracea]